ncbi:Rv1355c family protein [soil metagenome]
MKNIHPELADNIYLPKIFSLQAIEDKVAVAALKDAHPELKVRDFFMLQKKELLKSRNPGKPINAADLDLFYNESLSNRDADTEGCWVYYPWLNTLVHTLSKPEFIELRTNRNHYKITHAEQQSLSTKTIGIIGLSVGHAVAVCMATERICGKLKLADFDSIELSNLNRIKTGIINIGVNKSIATAREIFEIDPFIDIECYPEGINDDNIEAFLLDGGKIDILVDECDSLDVKIQCRQEAKKYKIPVVMETSDKGMLDVERYDLEEQRPILHGLLNGIPLDKLKNLSNEQKIPLILKIADVNKGSLRGKVSMLEVGQSISTWPQLASAVTLGGGVVTDVCRRILLDQYNESGRYYIDIETLAGNTKPKATATTDVNPYKPFNIEEAVGIIKQISSSNNTAKPAYALVEQMVEAAAHAPSTGNDQPWKWIYDEGRLFLFHDHYRSFSFGDFDSIASYISLGAAYENLQLKSNQFGFNLKTDFFPLATASNLIAAISFSNINEGEAIERLYEPGLVNVISERCTNRNLSDAVIIPEQEIELLKHAAESIDGATFHCIADKKQILAIGKIIGECDRIRLLNTQGHKDFVDREMRWTPAHAEATRDGIDIRTLGVTGPLLTALSIIKDGEVTACLKDINGGKALVDAAMKTASTSSFIGMITLPNYCKEDFFAGGVAMQRMWLKATELGYALHPLISPFYLFPRILKGNGAGLDAGEVEKLKVLRNQFTNIVSLKDNGAEVFIFKIARAETPAIKTLRLPLSEILFETNK